MKYRFAGKENRLAIGVYPAVGLKAAREVASAARDLLKAGTDPSQQRRIDKLTQATSSENTFEAIPASGTSPSHQDGLKSTLAPS